MERKSKIKKRICSGTVIALILVVWVARVIYINRVSSVETVFLYLNDNIDCGKYTIVPSEARLFTLDDYEDFFQVDIDEGEATGGGANDKIIGLRLHITNTSTESLRWDEVLSDIGYGFESLTWCSVVNPWLGKDINILYDKEFKPGVGIDYWLVTRVARSSFGNGSWKDLKAEDFMFTLDIYPRPVRIIFR